MLQLKLHLLFITLLVSACTWQVPEVRPATSVPTITTIVPTSPLQVPNLTTPDCEFLQHVRDRRLLESFDEYTNVESAIASIYGVDIAEINVNITPKDNSPPSYYYEWIIAEPHYGQVYRSVGGTNDTVIEVGSSSFNTQPIALTLKDVLECLGSPTATSTFLIDIHGESLTNYGELRAGLVFVYSNTNFLLKLAYSPQDATLAPTTKVYFVSTTIVSQEAPYPERFEDRVGEMQPWPPPNWTLIGE